MDSCGYEWLRTTSMYKLFFAYMYTDHKRFLHAYAVFGVTIINFNIISFFSGQAAVQENISHYCIFKVAVLNNDKHKKMEFYVFRNYKLLLLKSTITCKYSQVCVHIPKCGFFLFSRRSRGKNPRPNDTGSQS